MKHDFAQLRIDKTNLIYTGSLGRRFVSVIIDVLISGSLLLVLGISSEHPTLGDSGTGVAGFINFGLFLVIFYCPELYFRKSLGMWIMDLVVIPPLDRNPSASLLIRKVMNLIEFTMPSLVYFWVTSLSKDYSSISDKASGCIIARGAVLNERIDPPIPHSQTQRVLTAVVASFIPIIVLIGIVVVFMMWGLKDITSQLNL